MRLNGSSDLMDKSTAHSSGPLNMSQTCHPEWTDSGEPLRPGSQVCPKNKVGKALAVKDMT